MRQRYVLKGFRRQLVTKLENALNSILAMDLRETATAAAQDRDPVPFSNGGSPAISTCITRLKARITELKALRA